MSPSQNEEPIGFYPLTGKHKQLKCDRPDTEEQCAARAKMMEERKFAFHHGFGCTSRIPQHVSDMKSDREADKILRETDMDDLIDKLLQEG